MLVSNDVLVDHGSRLRRTGNLPPDADTHRLNDSTNQQINLLLDRIYKISVKANVDCGSQI